MLSALLSEHYVVRKLGFIRRNASDLDQANCLLTLYASLVQSILEYESAIIKSVTIFFSFVRYVLRISHPPYNYTSVSEFLNLLNLEFKIGSCNKQIFEINTHKTNYLCNEPIQRTMRIINSNPGSKIFIPI